MNRRENTNKIPNKETLIIFTGYRTLNKKWIFNAYENFFLNISDQKAKQQFVIYTFRIKIQRMLLKQLELEKNYSVDYLEESEEF